MHLLIAFRDFIPQPLTTRILGMLKDYESMQEVVTRVNRWIEQENIQVLNVETLLTTAIPGHEDQDLRTKMEGPASAGSLYQAIRVWYIQHSSHEAAYVGVTQRLGEPMDEG